MNGEYAETLGIFSNFYSDDYRERNITKQTAFTRNRKLTYPVMIVLLLNFLTSTMQIELDDFFRVCIYKETC